jgi:Zn-dependent peptidase ImmA (M78 family)
MTDFVARLIRRFQIARAVNHYYWMHLDGEIDGKVRVENIQKIVQIITKHEIEITDVDVEGKIFRGIIERKPGRVIILVRSDQSPEWKRFTVVKELCHLLCDVEAEWEPDEEKALRNLLDPEPFFWDGNMPAACQTEHIAELIALELLYPLEFRKGDMKAVAAGEPIVAVAARRQVPPVYVERALSAKYDHASRSLWATCDPAPLPPIEDFDLGTFI